MFHLLQAIIAPAMQKAVNSSIINGYLAAKRIFSGKTSASNVAVDSTAQVIKDVGYEAMRAGLNVTLDAATTMVPGANMIKSLGLAGIASHFTTAGIRASLEDKSILKNGLYAINAMFVGPILSFPLNMITDCAVDGITYAYKRYTSNPTIIPENNEENNRNQRLSIA